MKKFLAPCLLGVFLAGCAVGPSYKQPTLAVPEQYRGVEGPPTPGESLADLQWWETFGDPVLKGLIDEALRNGYDVRIAASRVDEARARAGIAKSQFFPQIGYQPDVQLSDRNERRKRGLGEPERMAKLEDKAAPAPAAAHEGGH